MLGSFDYIAIKISERCFGFLCADRGSRGALLDRQNFLLVRVNENRQLGFHGDVVSL